MCSRFALALATRPGGRFHLRRDLGTLLALSGRHLVWPVTVLRRLRAFLEQRCGDNEWWDGQAGLNGPEFLERHGSWEGPYEEATLFFHLDDYAKEAPKDILAVLAASRDWLDRALDKQRSRVEANIDTLGELLQLNRAERVLLLYGTLARYQRELRNLLVECKVHNAHEAYAALGEVAGVDAAEVAEALRAGSRLERIGLVENLLSEHNITDLADLMKVSERLPPVLMREYRHHQELMAVFTRPALDRPWGWRTSISCTRTQPCCATCCVGRSRGARQASTCSFTAHPAPARPSSPRSWHTAPGWSCSKWSTPTAKATR